MLAENWRDEIVFPNWDHQNAELEHRDDKARALHWQMRTGKTKAMCDLASYRYENGEIDGVIILAPNNVHRNWVRKELGKHMWLSVPYRAMAWSSESMRIDPNFEIGLQSLLTFDGLAIIAVNVEATILPIPMSYVMHFAKNKRFMLIVDETHEWRKPTSKRWKFLNQVIAPRAVLKRNLSGTVIDNSPFHAYSQYEILEPGCLGNFKNYAEFEDYFGVFEEEYIFMKNKRGGRFKRKVRKLVEYRRLDLLRTRMSKLTSYVHRDEVKGLSGLEPKQVPYEMPLKQKRLYNEMASGILVRLESGELLDDADGAKAITRLQQLCSGYVFDEDKNPIDIYPVEKCPRLDVLVSLINLTPGKVVVFCRYRRDIERVMERLRLEKIGAVDYYGGTKNSMKSLNEDRFQNSDRVKVMVGQPKSCGQGLDFSAGEHIIWFSHLHGDLIARRQADERCSQVGGKVVAVTDISAVGSVDDKILADRDQKIEVAEFLTGEGLRNYLELIP